MTDPCSSREVGERVPLQVAAHLVGDRDPHLLQHAVTLAVVVLVGEGGERTVDGGEDLRERDLLGRAREHVAAADAALGPHQSRALDREQDLLEVGLRAGWCARRSPSPTSGCRTRAARATAARGRRSRRGSTPSSLCSSGSVGGHARTPDRSRSEAAGRPRGGVTVPAVTTPVPRPTRLRRRVGRRHRARAHRSHRPCVAARNRPVTPPRWCCSCSTAWVGSCCGTHAAELPELSALTGRRDHDRARRRPPPRR